MRRPGAAWRIKKPDVLWLWMLLLAGLLARLSFGSWFFILILWPMVLVRGKIALMAKERAQRSQLRRAFGTHIDFLSAAMQAGYGLENALYQYMAQLERQEIGPYETRLEQLAPELRHGIGVREYFRRLQQDFHLDELDRFCTLLEVGFSTGGPLIRLFRETATQAKTNRYMEGELVSLIAEKRLEAQLIGWMPYGVILFMRLTMGEIWMPISTTPFGWLFLQILVLIFEASAYWASKISDIRIS